VVAALAVVVAVFANFLPGIADYTDVLDVVRGLSTLQLLLLAVVGVINILTFPPPWMAALPGLSLPAAAAFVAAVGGTVNPKFGWTDVARFSGLGIPAVNFGPGDPHLAHRQDEFVPLEQVTTVERQLRAWLEAGS